MQIKNLNASDKISSLKSTKIANKASSGMIANPSDRNQKILNQMKSLSPEASSLLSTPGIVGEKLSQRPRTVNSNNNKAKDQIKNVKVSNNNQKTSKNNKGNIITQMCEGNFQLQPLILQLMADPYTYFALMNCNELGIRGYKFFVLYNYCCQGNNNKFIRTVQMLKGNFCTKTEMMENLLYFGMSFIDDDITINGVPQYGYDFGPSYAQWNPFMYQNRMSFQAKLAQAKAQYAMLYGGMNSWPLQSFYMNQYDEGYAPMGRMY